MFFSNVYGSWEEIQEAKFLEMQKILGDDFFAALGRCRTLDLGCGNGYFHKFLSKLTDVNVIIGLDNNLELISQSTEKKVLGNGNELPFSKEVFDVVVCFDAIHLIEKDDFVRVLRPGGIFLAGIFSRGEEKMSLRDRCKNLEIITEFEIQGKENEHVILARKPTSSSKA